MVQVAMQGTGASVGNTMGMGGQHARQGGPDIGQGQAAGLSAMEMEARQHFVPPSNEYDANNQVQNRRARINPLADDVPYYYNQYDGLPVPYAAPSEQKERFLLRSAVRDAAAAEIRNSGGTGVLRTDPITEGEVDYLKSMKDMAELAKFDDYVESFIDPRMPGNMKWLMEVYPDYVSRRLQQAHTDYEFALRNQMIDSWGMNTFDDLHFKYLVDQGKISGPRLLNPQPPIDSSYTPGWLSPYNFQSPNMGGTGMALPFNSAQHGKRPRRAEGRWVMDRQFRPLGRGNTPQELARGMYDINTPATKQMSTAAFNPRGAVGLLGPRPAPTPPAVAGA